MARGRKPKPAHLRLIEGNTRHRPASPPGVEDPRPLGPPPDDWDAAAKAVWHEVAAQLVYGAAAQADRMVFELMVRLLIKARTSPEAITPALAAQIRCYASEFGMSPASRVRLTADPAQPASKFAGLIGGRPS